MDPEKIMDGISKELLSTLKAMSSTKDVKEKVAYSEVVNNLCNSLGVFLDVASSMMDFEEDEE
ncbi:MAG TPA: hypothetical protein VK564_10495 [Thermodesulfobacteriota bacterium]|nr:hypothetical protein [Thermodesulfobacteriota bacterium]